MRVQGFVHKVKILKLSNNKLETCRNSGLEKCYALREVWLDSNHIQDISEVLAGPSVPRPATESLLDPKDIDGLVCKG